MAYIDLLRASDGSGNAQVATVQSTRTALASTIVVDTVDGINDTFVGTMGTPHTFTDPVTSETITVISEATAVDFAGHVDGANLEIDTIAPGYTDAGSEIGDIVIIRPTTQYADNLADVLDVSHNDDGTIKDAAISDENMFADDVIASEAPFADAMDPVKRFVDDFFDHIASGCVWTADAAGSTRVASCTAGVVYIAGKRLTVAAVTSRTFTASKDVYADLKDNGDGTAVWVYYDNTLNAASPSFGTTTGTVRGAIVVVGASSIAAAASINQGQENRVLPIASSTPYTVTDSLGNLICPRDPNRKILGYRQIVSDSTIASATIAQIVGLSVPIIVPTGRKILCTLKSPANRNDDAAGQTIIGIHEGAISGATNQKDVDYYNQAAADELMGMTVLAVWTPATENVTINGGKQTNGTGTSTISAAVDRPVFLMVELA